MKKLHKAAFVFTRFHFMAAAAALISALATVFSACYAQTSAQGMSGYAPERNSNSVTRPEMYPTATPQDSIKIDYSGIRPVFSAGKPLETLPESKTDLIGREYTENLARFNKLQAEIGREFTDDMEKYYSDFVLVGDSICSGFASGGFFEQDRNFARPCIAAWNIHQFLISANGEKTDVLMHLYNAQSKYILFSMGLNDVNLTDEQEFTDNYIQLLKDAKAASPNSEMVVMAITPVAGMYAPNYKIDRYNAALKSAIEDMGDKHIHFVNPSEYLKGVYNRLYAPYAFEDGIHLEMDGMKVCLWYIYNQGIQYSFEESELVTPQLPDLSEYEYLY